MSKSCAQIINRGNKIINRAHDLTYNFFLACHVQGSVPTKLFIFQIWVIELATLGCHMFSGDKLNQS